MTDEQEKNLKDIHGTQYGKSLHIFLDEEIANYNDVTKATPEDLIGRQLVVKELQKIKRLTSKEPLIPKSNTNQYV